MALTQKTCAVAAAATVLTRKKKQGQITALPSYYCAGSHSTPELTLMRDNGSRKMYQLMSANVGVILLFTKLIFIHRFLWTISKTKQKTVELYEEKRSLNISNQENATLLTQK